MTAHRVATQHPRRVIVPVVFLYVPADADATAVEPL